MSGQRTMPRNLRESAAQQLHEVVLHCETQAIKEVPVAMLREILSDEKTFDLFTLMRRHGL